jgi:hypothetical protein
MKQPIPLVASLVIAAFAITFTLSSDHNRTLQAQGKKQPSENLDKIRSDLKQVKRDLARQGNYACCISPSCDHCAIAVGKCTCNENLASGKPVCYDCKGGWVGGYGVIDGVNARDVQVTPPEMTKMMYDARAKNYLKKK